MENRRESGRKSQARELQQRREGRRDTVRRKREPAPGAPLTSHTPPSTPTPQHRCLQHCNNFQSAAVGLERFSRWLVVAVDPNHRTAAAVSGYNRARPSQLHGCRVKRGLGDYRLSKGTAELTGRGFSFFLFFWGGTIRTASPGT